MKKIVFFVMLLTIGSKLLGFLRDITLSYFYGVSSISDAYLISQLIPMSILEFIGLGLLTGFIPIYNEIQKKYGSKESNNFSNNVINIVLLIDTILILLGLIFTENIVKIFAMGFEGSTLELAVKLTRITLFGIYFVTLTYIFRSFLQIKESYIIPTLLGFPLNIIIIASIYISTTTSVIVLALGSLLALSSQLILLIPYAYKKGFRFSLYFDPRNSYIKKLWYLAIPMILGISVNQINVLVDRTLASKIVEGGITALDYAFKLNFFVQGIFVLSITTVMYPMISRMVAENNKHGLNRAVKEAIGGVNLLVVPATIGTILFSNQIVNLLYGRGAFDSEAALLTSNALTYYSLGMLGMGLREVLSRVFYAIHDTKTPMINAAIGLFLNIILNVILSRYMGIGGLALATSISATFTTTLLLISLRKKIGFLGIKQISISFIKILFASLIMALVAKILFGYLVTIYSQNISLLITIAFGVVTYIIITYFIRVEDINIIIGTIKKMFEKK